METQFTCTWEELQQHAEELRGQQLRVTVLQPLRELTPAEVAERRKALDEFFEEMDERIANPPPPPPPRTKPDPFGDALVEKMRRQGLDL